MNGRGAVILLLGGCALLCGGCGASGNGSIEDGGSPPPDAGDASPSTTPHVDASSGEASSPGLDASSVVPPPDAGGSPVDGASPSDGGTGRASDAADGDAGAQPFKGVANSACADLVTFGVSWWYNWTLSPSGCTSKPFVPMIWGHTGSEQTAAGITSEVNSIVSAGYKYVLGFNEPDNTGQSNLEVATAISLWPSFNHPSLQIGSPAPQGKSTGLTWLQDFMTQVNADTTGTLRVDFIATHWYGWNTGSCDAQAAGLESWIAGVEAIPGNRPIWITEWGCLNDSNPDVATVQAFFSGALKMFAKHPRIERYAWYPWETNNELVNADGGALTSLGTVFTAAPSLQ